MTRSTEVVVGWDGSPDSRAALDWAVREAGGQGYRIRVVYCEPDVHAWDGASASISGAPVLVPALDPALGDALLAEAVAVVSSSEIRVEAVNTAGSIAAELVAQSRTARMVVIGSRGHGALSSAILGSTVSHVASHSHCPVVVAQAAGPAGGPVVVGVDGSVHSQHLVGWAIDQASRHGLPLEVLHAYTMPVYPGVVPYVPPDGISRATLEIERRVAAETSAGWRERYPDVEVTTTVQFGRPAPMLVAASKRASLTVVGSRGRGAFLGMLLGSTSQSLLQHAHGCVAVLRNDPVDSG